MARIETELSDGWEFAKEECREDNFHKVTLPHDWAAGVPFDRNMEEGESQGFRSRFGVGWYRSRMTIGQKQEDANYYLEFGGVCENCTVWVNGKEAGGQKYGYSTFRLDVTELVEEGENQLLVRVDTTARPADRWYSGAGIYRKVKLIRTGKEHFDPWEVRVHTHIKGKEDGTPSYGASKGHEASVTVCAGLVGKRVRAELFDADNTLVAEAEGDGGSLELSAGNIRLWSAEEPNLYMLALFLMEGEQVADRVSLRIGFRRIELIAGQGMFVNGSRVKIKGVCLHQDVGSLGLAAVKEIYRQRLMALKEMGCNAIRPSHHTFSSEFLDLCDEMGFYVYEECFDKWHGGLYGRYFESGWKKDVDAMVKRDRNRPCIFMWGVGNEVENQGQESMLKTLKLLTNYVRSLDERPVSCAMNPHFKREDKADVSRVKDIQKFVDEVSDTEIYDNEERVERIAGIARYVDVLACNYQEQWYPLIHEKLPDKLILGTEVYQYFMGDFHQMQNFTDRNPVHAVRELDYVIGSYIWTGIDYLGESMGYPAKGWGGSLIRTNGNRRPGYYIMQSYWSKEPMVYFAVADYSQADEGTKEHWDIPMLAQHWHFPQFHKAVIPYIIASNCEEVRIYLNGKRFYLPKPMECRNGIISGFLPYQPGTVEVVGLREGKQMCRQIIRTPGMAAKMKFLGDAWRCGGSREDSGECIKLPARKDFQIQLSAGAFDGEDNPCFRESAKVRFRIEGPAGILAVDAGDITGSESYQEDFIHMFHGQASVVISLTGEPGRICVYADAEGMRTGRQVIVAV